ncbi:MAG: PQQ-like beta-propeller repeat protein [Planctomycetota bacterium]|nr:PQQ-like beta-propeller repeat protein [Planctomycetota bacterium]
MGERRFPWLPAGAGLLLAGAAVAAAVFLKRPLEHSDPLPDGSHAPRPPLAQDDPEEPAAKPGPASENPAVTFRAAPKPLAPQAVTQDWPNLLGPTHDFVSAETKLLKTWPKNGPALVWEMKKGSGYAAPALKDGVLVFFQRQGEEEVVEALEAETGRRYWRFAYPSHYQDRYGYNNGPRAAPVIDGSRVYVYGAAGMLHCLDLATGRKRWELDTLQTYGLAQNFFGAGASPLLEGNLLILNVGAPGACAVALDKFSGKEVWRAGSGSVAWGASYATPVPAVLRGRRRVLVFAGGESRPPSGGLLCLDPATGKTDFAFPWRSRSYESVNATSPVVAGDRVFLTASYETGGAMLEIRPDGTAREAWTAPNFGSHFGAVLARDGLLYGFDGRHERGTELVCFDAATGEEKWRGAPSWQEEVDGRAIAIDPGRGALLWADGGALCLGEFGHLLWLDLTPKGCEVRARAWLFQAGQTWTPPVVHRGLLFVCQNERGHEAEPALPRLLCYDLRGE